MLEVAIAFSDVEPRIALPFRYFFVLFSCVEVTMARDRNVYVWQAYVIVMSIVSVLCMGFLAFVVFQSGTNYKTVQGALEKEKEANDKLRKAIEARQILEAVIGGGKPYTKTEFEQLLAQHGADPTVDAVVQSHKSNMELAGPGLTERTYTKLVDSLMQELRSRNQQIDSMSKKSEEQKEKYDATIAQETKAREAERQKAQDYASQLEKTTTDYTSKIDEQQKSITKIELDKQNRLKDADRKYKELQVKLDKSDEALAEVTKRNDALARKLEQIIGEDFQYVQGKITEVADGGKTVWINLGKADGLRPGVTFGVLDGDITRVADAKPKARIEVVSIVAESEHLARCKVLSDRSPTTILNGDSIYSPTWQTGSKAQFYLLGKMDWDGDGKDDSDLIKSLIRQNNAEVTELSVNTRFMVVGEDIKIGKERDEKTDAANKDRAEIEKKARALGVTRMNLDNLKGWLMGSGATEVTAIGNKMRAKPSDYLPEGSKYNAGRVSGLYQDADKKLNRKGLQP